MFKVKVTAASEETRNAVLQLDEELRAIRTELSPYYKMDSSFTCKQ